MATPFSPAELSSSLAEIASWGLSSYEILPEAFCKPSEARASLALLEPGDTALVAVSPAGWKVCLRSVVDYGRLPEDSAAKDDQVFETLDHLMAYLSPAFEEKRIQVLADRLGEISVRRNWGEKEGEEGSKGEVGEEAAKAP